MQYRTNLRPLKTQAREALKKAFHEIGQQLRDELRKMVSVPVQYITGPRGGTIIVRSLPGEPPRRENKKRYRESIKVSVRDMRGTTLLLRVTSEDERKEWFEKSTARMLPRPHFSVIAKKYGDITRRVKLRFSRAMKASRADPFNALPKRKR
jgi:hypothetical protein